MLAEGGIRKVGTACRMASARAPPLDVGINLEKGVPFFLGYLGFLWFLTHSASLWTFKLFGKAHLVENNKFGFGGSVHPGRKVTGSQKDTTVPFAPPKTDTQNWRVEAQLSKWMVFYLRRESLFFPLVPDRGLKQFPLSKANLFRVPLGPPNS